MNFTRIKISDLMHKYTEKGNGLYDLTESIMVVKRGEFLRENPDNKSNSYRPSHP